MAKVKEGIHVGKERIRTGESRVEIRGNVGEGAATVEKETPWQG